MDETTTQQPSKTKIRKAKAIIKDEQKKAAFKKYSHEEAKKDRAMHLSHQNREKIQEIHELQYQFLNLKIMESRMRFRLTQLGLSASGEKISEPNVQEHFEGALKPVDMLEAEYNADLYGYKRCVGEIERLKRKMVSVYKYKEQDVQDMLTGNFDLTGIKEDEKEDSTYIG